MPLLARLAGLTLSAVLVFVLIPGSIGAQPPPANPHGGQPRVGDGQKPGQRPGSGKPTDAQKRGDRPGGRQPSAPPRGRAERPHPTHVPPAPRARGRVFIGGYFYDQAFGPYPWWRRPDYPNWYYPIYDNRAELHLKVTPDAAKLAAVYVDGFYAGIVDDFDGVFQELPLPPGGHSIVLYLEGYRTVRHNLYLPHGSRYTLREALLRLPPGATSDPPELAPAIPTPPSGSYTVPATPSTVPATEAATAAAVQAAGYGTLDLFVQPASADVAIDGRKWVSSEGGHFMVRVSAGTHRVEVSRPGYQQYAADIEVKDGETTTLNVSLAATP